MRSVLAATVLGFGAVHGAPADGGRLREALLKEARERLTTWYDNKDSLELPFWRDGAQVQMSKGECLCDGPGSGGKVPLTFGQFDVDGARPVDVFNVLANTRTQTTWDPTVSQVKEIPGDWVKDDGVRALEMVYPAGIIFVPDREIFEWAAYQADPQEQEFWVVYSTLDNSRMKETLPPISSAVAAQNCLGAYWIRRKPDGSGTHVLFTQHVNPHPPMMISAKLVFDVSWGKQIDYINILRQQAQKQAKLGWADDRTVVAKELLQEGPAAAQPGAVGSWTGSEQKSSGVFREIDASFYRLWSEARPAAAQAPRAFGLAASAGLFAAASLVAAGAVLGLRRRRGRAQGEASARQAALAKLEEASLLEEA